MYRKDWISKWAEYTPDKIAVKEYETGHSITYGQLNAQANRLALHLQNHFKLSYGDRLMVLAEYSILYVSLFSVMQKMGITLVPINFRLTPSEIDYLVTNCTPKLLIAEKKFAQKAEPMAQKVTVAWAEDMEVVAKAETRVDFPATAIEENHPAFILYTSGTTGFPKGAIYSHKMLLWNSINTSQSLELTPNDHTINCMPPFHTGGWNVLLTPLLHRGGSITLMRKFDAEAVLHCIDKEHVKLFMGVPTMLKMMAETEQFTLSSLESLRYFIVGGEALPLEVIQTWHQKGVKIRQGYGLTEVGPNITSLHQDDAERKIGSIGRPNFYVDYQLLDDARNPVPQGEIGEFCLKGPMVTPGYWQNAEATAKALQAEYFHTGDLVKEDAEGFLYVVDRKKSMFISGGENVYPAEVERIIRTHDSIDEVAVVGVPDAQWGEVGKAFCTLRKGATFNEASLRAYCLEKMAKFKVPKFFVFLEEMPKNDSGKIDRKTLNNL